MKELQWGRDLSIAETARASSSSTPGTPLQWGRDLSIAETSPPTRSTGSSTGCFNGAATFRSRKHRGRGNLLYVILFDRLQWGRDLSIAETGPVTVIAPQATALQWGRDLSIAET